MDVLTSIIGFVLKRQLVPNLAILSGLSIAYFIYEVSGRHTGVVALFVCLALAGSLAFVVWIGRGPDQQRDE